MTTTYEPIGMCIPPEATDKHDATTGEIYRHWFSLFLDSIKLEHTNRLSYLRELIKRIKNEEFSIEESIDIGFLLRECEKHLDEMRKDFKAHKEASSKQTCYRLSLEYKDSSSGKLSRGSLRAKHSSNLPHPVKDPEKFMKLCKFFEINTDNVPLGSIRFHWPTVKNYITQCMEEGKELPDELSDVSVELEMTYRRLSNGKEE